MSPRIAAIMLALTVALVPAIAHRAEPIDHTWRCAYGNTESGQGMWACDRDDGKGTLPAPWSCYAPGHCETTASAEDDPRAYAQLPEGWQT